jgi:hypothetical protein
MWWAHNGLHNHDDWDLSIAYRSNQYDEPEQQATAVEPVPITISMSTSTVSVMTQTPAAMTDPVGVYIINPL